jgi:hypothetical protein
MLKTAANFKLAQQQHTLVLLEEGMVESCATTAWPILLDTSNAIVEGEYAGATACSSSTTA